MIHPAVPRAGGHAQPRKLLHKKNVLPAFGYRASDRAADHAASYDQNVCLVHETERIKQKFNLRGNFETESFLTYSSSETSCLLIPTRFIEKRLAGNQPRLAPVVNR